MDDRQKSIEYYIMMWMIVVVLFAVCVYTYSKEFKFYSKAKFTVATAEDETQWFEESTDSKSIDGEKSQTVYVSTLIFRNNNGYIRKGSSDLEAYIHPKLGEKVHIAYLPDNVPFDITNRDTEIRLLTPGDIIMHLLPLFMLIICICLARPIEHRKSKKYKKSNNNKIKGFLN